MQRIFRRRARGSSRRGTGGLLGRLPPGLLRGRSNAKRPAWGRKAAAPAPSGHELQQTQDTQVIVQQVPGGAGAGGPGFRDRGRLRRRLRFLRRARELAFRDIGGLMFDMRRFGRERPDLVEAKIAALAAVDRELRALERILDDRRPLHELHEPGITSCARCGALHASDSNFCPHCGLQVGGPRAMGEVGGAIAAPPQPPLEPVHRPASPAVAAPPPPAPPPPPSPGSAPAPDSTSGRPASSTTSQPTETMRPPRAPDDGS
ncbi:MAG: zinc ribbon domain-containing protein [Actinobacteria bacterium]|nr:zinc ribbon domain-containing protein [Actinomycetota bacterium]